MSIPGTPIVEDNIMVSVPEVVVIAVTPGTPTAKFEVTVWSLETVGIVTAPVAGLLVSVPGTPMAEVVAIV